MNIPVSNQQLGGASLGLTAGGSIMGAFGSLASGMSNSSMMNYQAAVAKLNQQIAGQNAEFATQTGEQQAFQQGLKGQQAMGQIKVAQAASGFDVRSGSNADVQASQRQINQLDTDVIRSNAAKTAYGFQEQGAVDASQAQVYSMAGSNALTAGALGAGSSLIGGAASVSSQWLQGRTNGTFGGSF